MFSPTAGRLAAAVAGALDEAAGGEGSGDKIEVA